MQLRRLVTPVVIGAAVVTVTALAASAHGYPVQHVSMNDGGIWVTDDNAAGGGSGAEIARFAKPIEQLDGQLTPQSATGVDVWQNGPLVAAYASAPAGGRMYAVNVDQPDFADPAGSPVSPVSPDTSGIAVSVEPDAGSATIAVLGGGSLRSAALGAGGGLDSLSLSAPALAKHLAPDSVVAVGTDNSIWVAGGGELLEFPQGATTPAVTKLPQVIAAGDSLQVTTVGNVPVVADLTAKELYLPDGDQTISLRSLPSTTGFALQQASPASGVAVMATSTSLYSVSLSSGQLDQLSTGESGTAAAPVQVGGCVQAAWAQGEAGSYLRTCGTPPPSAGAPQTFSTGDPNPQLVFRVNNGEVVLNDTANGGVFVTDATIKNVTPKWQQSSTGPQSNVQVQGGQQKEQFQATAMTQGVRPGVTTEVHVLDAVKGDPAQTYAVTAVGTPDQPGVTVSVSPDAQTVLATVTTLSADAHFQYTVSDGHGHSATNQVTLVPHPPSENSAPNLKQSYQQPPLSVDSGGTLVVPVIGDWRDGDGDPLYIDSGSVSASAGSAAVTSGGALSFTAPRTAADETVTVSYGVSDGRVAKPTPATLRVSVLGASAKSFVAPVAEPDAAQAVAGTPITLHPLANDLPGVDWTNPQATLRLAAPLAQVPGTAVATDVADGTVTFTAPQAGDYFLSYTDAYGAAPTAKAAIRVHVVPAYGKPKPPVTTPDVAVLHGQQPALVDVLADDTDPQGWLLGVTDATSDTQGVHVAVVDQQWLRISADDPAMGLTATVSYTVSDGKGSATGTVAVSAVAADPAADQITTTLATVTVQAGDSAAVPVLGGDASSTDLPLILAGTPPTMSPPVAGLITSAQGADIRVDAPSSAKAEEETAVSYVATDADGTTATGELDVTIVPAPLTAAQDQPPTPEEIDTREAAGDTAVIQVPVSGVDPAGDSVTVTGVTVPPTLGRIVAVSPDTISYQSYPGSAGTDSFTYQVTDPYGRTGTAQVRIAVLPPGPPQPPVAVDDVISAPPGAPLHWDVLGNDYIAPGDTVTVEPLAKTNPVQPPGVRLIGPYVYLQVPSAPSDPPVQFTYGATDGSTPSLAQVIVHAVKGAQVPPIANDAVAPAPAGGASTVTVNVLKNDDDPVGSPSDLKISWAGAGVTVAGADLVIKLTAYPREVPYEVTAPDGLTATAVVYVPGSQSSVISLKPGARVTVKENGTVTVPLSSVLTDSAGRQLKITTTAALTASPSTGLAVSANQESAFTLHALGGYAGPGAVTVQVYDGQQIQDGTVATVTIPVQVGSDAPVLHCPATPLPVVEGGAPVSYDIGQLCHVSLDSTVQAEPHYTATWAKAAGGVSATVPGGTGLALSAASGATPGVTGTLRITPAGATAGGTLSVEVVRAPLPAGRAASVSVAAGQSVTVDLRQYVTSPLAQPVISVLAVATQAGSTATAAVTHSGSTITITPGADAKGALALAASVSDQPGRADRAIEVAVTVTVIGHPDAPSGTPTVTESSHTLVVSFGAAAPNGAPVEYYTVYTNGAPHQCPASPCTVTGLTNGTVYTVYVTATNSAGTSADSAQATAEPNAVPDQVTGLAATPGDGTVALTWQPAQVDGTPVTGYEVEVSPPPSGQQQITSAGVTTSQTFTGLTNGTTYTFTVMAVNTAGDSPWSLGVSTIPYGKPIVTGAPAATSAPVPDPAATLAITVDVSSLTVNSNGSPVTSYTVDEYKAASSGGPFSGTAFATEDIAGTGGDATFTVTNDGSWYEYAVIATNKAGDSAQSSTSTPAIQAVAPPDAPSGVTAKATGQANTIQFSFTPGAANGAEVSSIEYGINGASETGTFPGPFTAGSSYTETLTNATSSAIADGSPVTVYVAECNEASLCSSFSGPSAQVTPYGPIATPTVTASASGTTINYTWSAQSDGLSETLQVCIAGSCANYAVGATGGLNGSASDNYGNSQTETITGHLTDTAGQSSGTASASATTVAAPAASVSVGEGSSITDGSGTCAGKTCYFFNVTAANFPGGTTLSYTCADSGGVYWGPTTQAYAGSTTTNGGGSASFTTECIHANDGETVTIAVSGGGKNASGSYHT